MHNRKRSVWPPPRPTASGRRQWLERSASGERLREGASLVNRSAVIELEKHAVRSWETKEANAPEEPESAKKLETVLYRSQSGRFSRQCSAYFSRPDAKPPLSVAYKPAETCREKPQMLQVMETIKSRDEAGAGEVAIPVSGDETRTT